MAPIPGADASAGAGYVSDQEPNDTRASAAALLWQEGGGPLVVQGVLSGAGDTDVFSLPVFAGSASAQVALSALVPHHDLRLTVLSHRSEAASDRLEVNLGGQGVVELIPSVGLESGGLFLQVNASQSSTAAEAMPYKIIITPNALPPSDTAGLELEPNNNLNNATPHAASHKSPKRAAWVNRADDLDIFALTIAPTLPATLQVWPPDGCPLSVQLLEAPGGERSLIWEATTGQKANQPAEFLSLKPGAYFVRVQPGSGCGFSSKPLAYSLSLHTEDPQSQSPPAELEPNDDPEATHVLTLPPSGRLQVKAALLTADDIDHFRVELPPADPSEPPRLIRVLASPVDRTLDLSLHTHLVEATFEQAFDQARAGLPEALCDAVAPGPTTLDLRVAQSEAAGAAVFAAPRLYNLDVLVHTPPDAEREPNDLPGIATPLTERVSGHIYPDGDADTFRFTLTQDQHVTLSIDPGEALNLALALRDDTGEAIAQADRRQVGEPETLSADLPPGTYLVTVTSRHGFSCATPYVLRLSAPTSDLRTTP